MRSGSVILMCFGSALLIACGAQLPKPSGLHIQSENAGLEQAASIPQPVKRTIPLPPPEAAPKAETYSVVVTSVPAQEVLFALARDAKINLDIHAGIEGAVTLNAIDQTLPQILNRIAKQVDMRYEMDGLNLVIMPDSPFLKHYRIDYVNMSRDADSAISDSTHVGTSAAGTASVPGMPGGMSAGSNSLLAIKNVSKNHFWETLIQNIKDILRETDKVLPAGSSETLVQQSSAISTTGTGAQQPSGARKASVKQSGIENSPIPATLQEGGTTVTRTSTFREAASVIANPESGLIAVRATGKQHEKIQEFIDQIMANARRQVMIEATVVEVRLSDQYQQGINWQRLRAAGTKGFTLTQQGTAGLPASKTGSMFILDYANPASSFGNLSATVSLLESFGTVKVLSSPKLSVMNSQTAVLRVVDNKVYFIVNSTTAPCSPAPCTPIVTYTTTVNTVPIGFTMSVTPQINMNDTVLLNIRPSITRLLTEATDPTPGLAVTNKVPQTSTREMESVLKIESNQIAVLGGLMEDRIDNYTDAIPGAAKIPLIGNLFKNRNDTTTKTELVIFLRPVVIKESGLNGELSQFRNSLPDENFFKESGNTMGSNIRP